MIKRFTPRTLLARSLLILVTPVLLIQVITTYIFFDRHWQSISDRLAGAVAGEVAVVVSALEDDFSEERFDWVSDNLLGKLNLEMSFKVGEWIAADDDAAFYQFWKRILVESLRRELSAQIPNSYNINADFDEKKVTLQIQIREGVLVVEVPERRLFSATSYIFLLWMVGASIILLVIAILFMRNQVRPIRKLAAAAERLGKGQDVSQFRPSGAREVRQATRSFITMRDRIKRQIEQRTFMLAGISHDLRTPLTRMKLQLEMMPDSEDKKAMCEDIAHMQQMIDGYLDFVRDNSEEIVEDINLHELISKIVESYPDTKFLSEGALYGKVKPLALTRAIENVVNNANKYGSNCYVSIWQQKKNICIVIEDDGPGLTKDQQDQAFRPFYRAESSRNQDSGGVGLGLAITQDIIHSHGGEVTLSESQRYGGLKIEITLPH